MRRQEYRPIPENAEKYKVLYERYSRFGEFAEKEKITDDKAISALR